MDGRTATLLAALCGGLVACDATEPVACTDQAVAGVSVEAVDSLTRAPVTSGLVGYVNDGSYSERLTPTGAARLAGAWERGGDYTLRVTATGYLAWVRSGVKVEEGTCHVIPVSVTAEMVPTTGGR